MQDSVRLFVGGLPPNVTDQQLAGRFACFGKLAAMHLIPDKLHDDTACCRGFAYIDFVPQNDQALHRCLSLYNGCKWLGGVLRVEKAREHFLSKLQKEWDSEPAHEINTAESEIPAASEGPLRIPTPASGFVKRKLMGVQPNPVKRIFAPIKGQRLGALSWDPAPDPPGVRKRKAAEQAAAEYSSKRQAVPAQPELASGSQEQRGTNPSAGRIAEEHATQDEKKQQHLQPHSSANAELEAVESEKSHPAQSAAVPSESSASSDAGVVDFMSEDDMAADTAQGPAVDHTSTHTRTDAGLSRFGSDTDDEEENPEMTDGLAQTHTRTEAALVMSHSSDDPDGAPAQSPDADAACTNAVDALSRFDSDSDDSMEQRTAAAAPATDAGKHAQTDTGNVAAAGLSSLNTAVNGNPVRLPVPACSGPAVSRFDSDSDNGSDSGDKQDAADLIAELEDRDSVTAQPGPVIASSASEDGSTGVSQSASSDKEVDPEAQAPVREAGADLADSLTDPSSGAQSAPPCSQLDQATTPGNHHHHGLTHIQNPDHDQRQALDAEPRSSAPSMGQNGHSDSSHASSSASSDVDIQHNAVQEDEQEEVNGDHATEQDEVTAAEDQRGPQNVAAALTLYPDLKVLPYGANFWGQHDTVSDKAWQAQRMALQKDYRDKRRAATKHLQRKRKTSRS